ncbi:hypothetical protein EVAR_5588_1 [Eumeta japonica]|uniref:Uncharacterized protein n=1 Tax=Eumeta variegata TaxID=151549 RepID=A0A4C1U1P0_EUMVA|nr:hypothetical protein EVAR_5588_1 [Eumeta japonica]
MTKRDRSRYREGSVHTCKGLEALQNTSSRLMSLSLPPLSSQELYLLIIIKRHRISCEDAMGTRADINFPNLLRESRYPSLLIVCRCPGPSTSVSCRPVVRQMKLLRSVRKRGVVTNIGTASAFFHLSKYLDEFYPQREVSARGNLRKGFDSQTARRKRPALPEESVCEQEDNERK